MEFSEEQYAKNLMDFSDLNREYGAFGNCLQIWLRKTRRRETPGLMTLKKMSGSISLTIPTGSMYCSESLIQEHSLSISSGSDKAQYYFSGSYYNDNGQTIGQYAKPVYCQHAFKFCCFKPSHHWAILSGSVRDQLVFGASEGETENGITTREYDVNPYNYAINTSRP